MRPDITPYERLQTARAMRPLCLGQSKPHIFKHEGIYRVSLTPRKLLGEKGAPYREKRRRWTDAYGWLARMGDRLP